MNASRVAMRAGVALALVGMAFGRGEPGAGDRDGPELVRIASGSRVGQEPPPGWNHLIVKSIPRLASGDLDTLPGWSADLATLIRTAIVADVRRSANDPMHFELARIGVGLCVPMEGQGDVAVRLADLEGVGVDLSMIERQVLAAAEAEVDRGRLVVAEPDFAVLRTPAALRRGGAHHKVDLYYAFLVDPRTGRLDAAVWALDQDPETRRPPGVVIALGPPPVFDCPLDVKARRIAGVVPVSWSFAMRSLPPGTALDVPDDLAKTLVAVAEGRFDVRALRRGLAAILSRAHPNATWNRRPALPSR